MDRICENCINFKKKEYSKTNPFKDMIGICNYKTNHYKKKEKIVVKLSTCPRHRFKSNLMQKKWEELVKATKKAKKEFFKK